jgi:hypothetical protein
MLSTVLALTRLRDNVLKANLPGANLRASYSEHHKFDKCRANQCRLAVARNARHYLRVPNISSMMPTLSAKTLPSFKLTRVSKSQENESILLERSSRGGGFTTPFGSPWLSTGGGFS